MKIIMLCSSLSERSGWDRYAHDVALRIADRAEIVVLCAEENESLAMHMPQKRVLRTPSSYLSHPLWVLWDAWKVRRAIRREIRPGEETVVHCTNEGHAMFIPFLRGLGVRTVMTTHGTYSVLPLLSWKMRWLYRWMYAQVDRIVAVSEYTRHHLRKHADGIVDPGKILVITNGVDFKEQPSRIVRNDGIFRILTVGGVKHRKGSHHLVSVARILRERNTFPFLITFVGYVHRDQSFFQALERSIQAGGIEDCVRFTGVITQEELDACYRESDLFALLSVHEHGHYEGYPLVFHEAAMWGLPSIGTFDCGAEDAIRNGETGILVDPTRHEEVAAIITEIQAGRRTFDPKICRDWARANDWSTKDLMRMYAF